MRIDFRAGAASDIKVERLGFAEAEPIGLWTLGAQSELRFPNSGFSDVDLDIEIFLRPFVDPSSLPRQRLCIRLNGECVHEGSHDDHTRIEIRHRCPTLEPGSSLILTLQHPDHCSPARIFGSGDVREIAFLLEHLVVLSSADQQFQPGILAAPSAAVDVDEVHAGRNGWLFLTGGSNEVLRYFVEPDFFAETEADDWADLVVERRRRCASLQARFCQIVAPEKISVYPEYVDFDLPNLFRHPLRLLEEALIRRGEQTLLINPLAAFLAHPDRDQLYMKTDTHWSYLAGLVVVGLLAERLGYRVAAQLDGHDVWQYELVGDLGAKLNPKHSERYYSVATLSGVERFHANEAALSFEANLKAGRPVVHQGINVAFRNSRPEAIDECVVVFGDSFMDFQPSNTTHIVAEAFKEVHFVWSAELDYRYILDVGATVVVAEVAERFMRRVPVDKVGATNSRGAHVRA